MDTRIIDLISSIAIVLLSSIYGTPLSVPHTKPTLIQPPPLPLIHPGEMADLALAAGILLRGREPEQGVIVNRVRRVLPLLDVLVAEVSEIGCKGVSVQEQDVVGIDLPDRIVQTIVVFDETDMFWLCGFVEGVVTGDPLVGFVVGGKLFPQPNYSVLVVLVIPEIGNVPSVVGVPVCVLTAGGGVQIKNGVNAVFAAEVDHPIEVLEPLFLENSRVMVVWEASLWLDDEARWGG